MSNTVLVTGAFGHIGKLTIQHLLANGFDVVALDLKTPKTTAVAAGFEGRIKII